ncbi:MOSC domain-containing protein [Roseicyclus persicicus]|uniref:Sulfurase n=1 Tax=Roseicyclus persicicus TaxID=2650661 RepID=A0A7X6JWX6_9RHOB|nr:MOSC domain-containing protein [Roseibacterium persicicum]NKX44175.1 sulfurase [Roseibacterium persicicum]
MPALLPTRFTATVIWLGHNADRGAALETAPLTEMPLTFAGYAGESRAGLTRPSDSRVLAQYRRGTPIRNTRQLSILSAEDLAAIAADMGLDALDPALVGASMVIAGIPDFTHVPPSARLQDEASGTTLTIDMENRPCTLPAKPIEGRHPGFGKAFKRAAVNRRGVTAWVEREGTIRLGATLRLHIPDQPVWPHLDAARADPA